jgi:hypothetical protein
MISLYASNRKWVLKPIANSKNKQIKREKEEGEKVSYIASAVMKI